MLKADLISCWNKEQNTKSYLPAKKYSDSDLKLSSDSKMPCENCCFVEHSVSMGKRISEY